MYAIRSYYEFKALMEASLNGDVKSTNELFYKYLNLMHVMFVESNPMPVKTALAQMGLIEESFRSPMCTMEDVNKAKVMSELKRLEII